jgi:hypothetical protein
MATDERAECERPPMRQLRFQFSYPGSPFTRHDPPAASSIGTGPRQVGIPSQGSCAFGEAFTAAIKTHRPDCQPVLVGCSPEAFGSLLLLDGDFARDPRRFRFGGLDSRIRGLSSRMSERSPCHNTLPKNCGRLSIFLTRSASDEAKLTGKE